MQRYDGKRPRSQTRQKRKRHRGRRASFGFEEQPGEARESLLLEQQGKRRRTEYDPRRAEILSHPSSVYDPYRLICGGVRRSGASSSSSSSGIARTHGPSVSSSSSSSLEATGTPRSSSLSASPFIPSPFGVPSRRTEQLDYSCRVQNIGLPENMVINWDGDEKSPVLVQEGKFHFLGPFGENASPSQNFNDSELISGHLWDMIVRRGPVRRKKMFHKINISLFTAGMSNAREISRRLTWAGAKVLYNTFDGADDVDAVVVGRLCKGAAEKYAAALFRSARDYSMLPVHTELWVWDSFESGNIPQSSAYYPTEYINAVRLLVKPAAALSSQRSSKPVSSSSMFSEPPQIIRVGRCVSERPSAGAQNLSAVGNPDSSLIRSNKLSGEDILRQVQAFLHRARPDMTNEDWNQFRWGLLATDSRASTLNYTGWSSGSSESKNTQQHNFIEQMTGQHKFEMNHALRERMVLLYYETMQDDEYKYYIRDTSREVRVVRMTLFPSCSCNQNDNGQLQLCRHIFFVTLKVLKCNQFDPVVWQKNLTGFELRFLAGRVPRTWEEVDPRICASEADRAHFCSSLNNQKKLEVSAYGVQRHGFRNESCSICCEELDELLSSQLSWCQVKCGTNFHTVCINQWIRVHKTCPICRAAWKGSSSSSAQQTSDEAQRSTINHGNITATQVSHREQNRANFVDNSFGRLGPGNDEEDEEDEEDGEEAESSDDGGVSDEEDDDKRTRGVWYVIRSGLSPDSDF